MVFFCQRFSFATKHESTVVSCEPAVVQVEAEETVMTKTKTKPVVREVPCFEVVFEDTVFFPEGGGQPDDRGVVTPARCVECGSSCPTQPPESCVPTADVAALFAGRVDDASSVKCPHGASVLRVLRRGPHAVHCLDAPLPVGSEVVQAIDWPRRKDHMQQHSAQHLLTAVAEQLCGVETTSWCLGRTTSYVELHTRSLTEAQLGDIEARANAIIAAALPVSVHEYARADDLPPEARGRGLPADHVGDVRVVSIGGLDANMCCGTHVSCTAQLQAIKVLASEPGKPNKTLVSFVAGDRLLKYMSECHGTLRSLNPLLHTGPEEYVSAVSKMQRCLKAAEKSSKEALKDLAAAEAKLLMQKVQQTWRLQCERNGDSHHRRVILVQLEDEDSRQATAGKPKNEEGGNIDDYDSKQASAIKPKNQAQGDKKMPSNASTEQDRGQENPNVSEVASDDAGPLMLVTHHRRLADMDYINAIANNFALKEAVLLLTAGEDKGPGAMLLTGPQQLVRLLGSKLCEVLEGRGGGKTRFTARVSALHRRRAAADAALTVLTQHSQV